MKQVAYPPVSEITRKRHAEVVQEIFETIPEGYDLLNRVLSLRRDVAWRRFAVEKMRFFQTRRLLDLATGTADLALAAVRRHGDIEVVGLDFVREMLVRGREKTLRAARISLVQGDVRELPLRIARFDVAAIAFGIRNVPVADRLAALKEMTRCVVPGGQVMILEMHLPESPYVRPLYRAYLSHLLPRIAGFLTANPAAYRYLADSIVNFPSPATFGSLMAAAGLRDIVQYPLTLGTTYLHIGRR
ncbi:MAG TPA: ubiquinone/menaquinone biosynthesis methyltransferase [Syntrophales bacterium]|nr:ubiquinone/menaquinone biosynthesis methyltransferase [Syntrophales bacterium]HQB14291.1 ubiquinone/menaquinone biosynthesis methyltransferase [Syntrophales bacterium]